jgi:hypothetical protein
MDETNARIHVDCLVTMTFYVRFLRLGLRSPCNRVRPSTAKGDERRILDLVAQFEQEITWTYCLAFVRSPDLHDVVASLTHAKHAALGRFHSPGMYYRSC